jgi:hypothetical protein
MSNDQITAALAERVMGWRVSPDRFLMGERGWKPRWKFQPSSRLSDAVRLLETAEPDEYAITAARGGDCLVSVRIGGRTGTASDHSAAIAITNAIARALEIDGHPAANREVRRA